MDRWIAWSKRAGEIREKYEHTETLLRKGLRRLRPGLFGTYEWREVLVLLYLLSTLKDSQRLLYMRFVKGMDVFMQGMEPRFREQTENMKEQGKTLLTAVEEELRYLHALSAEFEAIGNKIQAEDIEGGLFFKRIDESALGKIASEMTRYAPDAEIRKVRKTHRRVLGDEHACRTICREMERQARLAVERTKTVLYGGGNDTMVRSAATVVYFATYIGFWWGIIDEPLQTKIAMGAKVVGRIT